MAGSTTRVIVGLSGGVDSAVAALLACRAGHEVHGLFMANWDDEDVHCSVAEDFQDARAVARELRIPLHRVSFAPEYRARVFEHFLAEHRAGRTPNPDVLCNREIKFGLCLEHARRLGADLVATGHYARLLRGREGIELHQGADPDKDQSYFLHAVPRAAFERVWFPVGELVKPEVRALARAAGLPVFDKPDSTGICFIGERPFREFLAGNLPESAGPIETPAGERLGTHRGLAFYTLGQRGGLEIGGRRGGDGEPWYVAAKDLPGNRLIVVQGSDHPLLSSRGLRAHTLNWLVEPPERGRPLGAEARLRHRQRTVPCTARLADPDLLELEFPSPQRAVTPGQCAVLYRGTLCLGGGIIGSTDTAGPRAVGQASHAAL
jgi:tRNA-specific 2-thiouridylase